VAPNATIFHFAVTVSDVDRNVYETLDLRVARHPSETMRYMLTRTLAYALSFEEGITFSKGGLSQTEEPPIAIVDPTGIRVAWIDIGAPSAERLHKASKASRRVAVFTSALAALRREASSRSIHKADEIIVFGLETKLLDALEPHIDKHTDLEIVRTDGRLYLTLAGQTLEGELTRASLADVASQ